jgi:hypothetical protein
MTKGELGGGSCPRWLVLLQQPLQQMHGEYSPDALVHRFSSIRLATDYKNFLDLPIDNRHAYARLKALLRWITVYLARAAWCWNTWTVWLA